MIVPSDLGPAPPESPASAPAPTEIGHRLHAARQRAGLSLRALGERTGFSASFLSQVERGQVSPSLSSLGRIGHALDLRLSELVAEPAVANGPVIRRRVREGVRSEWSRATVQALLPPGSDDRLEVILVELEPGGRSGTTPVLRSGKELAFVVRGRLALTLDGRLHDLSQGDSVVYDAASPRQWDNPGRRPTELLLVALRGP